MSSRLLRSGKTKTGERKRVRVISSESASDSDEKIGGGRSTKRVARRKNVRQLSESSHDDENDDDQTGKGSHRKNIRKLMGKNDLTEDTLNAQAAERERKKRIARLQDKYNSTTDVVPTESAAAATSAEDSTTTTTTNAKLILEKDEESGFVLEVNPLLVRELKPHQVDGVRFLFTSTIESVAKLDQPPGGCILAHCMGLGKTFQVITFLHTVLSNEKVGLRTALILAPVNVVLNWKYEVDRWMGDSLDLAVWELTQMKTLKDRLLTLENWQSDGGVMIMGYDIYRTLGMGKSVKKADARQRFEKALLDPGPDIIVCDEGHILKNEKTGISQVVNRIKTRRRICLTGTPLQNNLGEYHCMVHFVKPNLLGSRLEFKNRFENPIRNGQCVDSTEVDVKIMKRRAHILHSLLDGCVHRRDYSALTAVLPPKQEYVISVRLSDKQIELYKTYLDNIVGDLNLDSLRARKSLFKDFQILQRVWTHPLALYLHQIDVERKGEDDGFIDDAESTPSGTSSESDGDSVEIISEDSAEAARRPRTRQNPGQKPGSSMPERVGTPLEYRGWWNKVLSEDDYSDRELSGKLVLLFEILRKCEEIGDKVLLFSQSLISLAVIEKLLSSRGTSSNNNSSDDDDDSNNATFSGKGSSWLFGIDYFRMDGSTAASVRKKYIERFNDPKNTQARLFLISTKAGSLGTNLVGANRVIIFDASWNPSHDIQAIFRVYRYGQTKPVYVYRFIAQGTMEERIYDRQVTKQSLALRVVDEQQIERHFSAADLEELYKFEPVDLAAKQKLPVLAPPRDRLLKDVIFDKSDWFVSYHEHDSLLQHREDENLTEEEKQSAWDEYKAEREGRRRLPPPPPPVATDAAGAFAAAATAAASSSTSVATLMNAMANDSAELDQMVSFLSLLGVTDRRVGQWIITGNKLIIASGEAVSTRLEHVVASWIQDNTSLASNGDALVQKLKELVNQLEAVVEQRRQEQQQQMLEWMTSRMMSDRPLFRSTPDASKYPPYQSKQQK